MKATLLMVKKNAWWIFYDNMERVILKCQFKNNIKNGYCLTYKNEKLVLTSKYISGKKTKEWTSIKAFKKENNLLDLQ